MNFMVQFETANLARLGRWGLQVSGNGFSIDGMWFLLFALLTFSQLDLPGCHRRRIPIVGHHQQCDIEFLVQTQQKLEDLT